MNITKKNVVEKMTKESHISFKDCTLLFESFLLNITKKSKIGSVKLSGFGTFSFKKTPIRHGRNPKTKDSYIIPEMNKLNFKPSNKVKEKIN